MATADGDGPRPAESTPRWLGWYVGLVAVSLLAVVYGASEGLFISWRPVTLRAATPSDPVRERYFGFDLDKKPDRIRNIAVAEGTFTLKTRVGATLYLVRSGDVRELNAFSVGRSPNRIGEPHWLGMTITLALGDTDLPEGTFTQLGSAGHSRGGGRGPGPDPRGAYSGRMIARRTFPYRLHDGVERIVYVEGTRDGFAVDPSMTPEPFAKANPQGDYLLVVAGMP